MSAVNIIEQPTSVVRRSAAVVSKSVQGRTLMPDDETGASRRGRKPAEDDGRRQFLTKMRPEVIKAIKQAALDDDTTAWRIMEEAAEEWLKRRKAGRGKA